MKSTEEMEQPAKQWQVEAVNVQLKEVSHKLDQLLQSQKDYVTHSQLEETSKQHREYTDDKVRVLETKYGPIYRLFWALMTAICIEAALIAFQIQKG
jgi:hypothetical protein